MMGLLWSVHLKHFGFVGLVLWAWFFGFFLGLFFCDRFSLIHLVWYFCVVGLVCKVRFCRYDLVGLVVVGRFVLVGMI